MNIYDISEKAGVSIATVSRVLNDSPHVSQKTREKVLAVINDCDYVPNAFARGRFETACVYAMVLCLVIFLTTRIQFILEKKVVHYQ